MWSVEEVHVNHLILIRRMSKWLSNQSTARLIMHAGTVCTGRNQLKVEDMSHWSFHNDQVFLLMTQEMNPHMAPIQYVRLFQNVTSLEM